MTQLKHKQSLTLSPSSLKLKHSYHHLNFTSSVHFKINATQYITFWHWWYFSNTNSTNVL